MASVTVPPVAATKTFTVPGVPGGVVATMVVELLTEKEAAAFVPNVTDVTPTKPVPVMVTVVPPFVDPAVGVMLVIVGAGR